MALSIDASVADASYLSIHDVGGQFVSFAAPSSELISALNMIFGPKHLPSDSPLASIEVVAMLGGNGWDIKVGDTILATLTDKAPIPLVAERMIEAACFAVAKQTSRILLRGVVFQKESAAVAIIGDDLDSAKILGFHLHSRGWYVVSFGYAFVSGLSLDVIGLGALASISSESIDQIPARYRSAVEASLWYVSGFDLTFYTVDPLRINPRTLPKAVLTHVVIVDGDIDAKPSLDDSINSDEIGSLAAHPLIGSIRVTRLTQGTPVASCGAVERWAFSVQESE